MLQLNQLYQLYQQENKYQKRIVELNLINFFCSLHIFIKP
jgi:hypothetical protein